MLQINYALQIRHLDIFGSCISYTDKSYNLLEFLCPAASSLSLSFFLPLDNETLLGYHTTASIRAEHYRLSLTSMWPLFLYVYRSYNCFVGREIKSLIMLK